MICSNCGKNISFVGKVCPFCNVDKTKQSRRHAAAFGGGMVGSAIGYWLGGCSGLIVGGLIGVAVGVIGTIIRENTDAT